MIPDPFLRNLSPAFNKCDLIILYIACSCFKICLEQNGRSQLIFENNRNSDTPKLMRHQQMLWRPSASDSEQVVPFFLTLCFPFHLFLKQAGTHFLEICPSSLELSMNFSVQRNACIAGYLFFLFCGNDRGRFAWLFSCVLQVTLAYLKSFGHSTCTQWRPAYFCSFCWGTQRETLPQDQWVKCLLWIPAAAAEESWGLF